MKRVLIITILAGLAFSAAGAILYSNTLESPFLFDSRPRILENPQLRLDHLSLDGLRNAAFRPPGSKSRPLANITFAINYLFDGDDTTGYHVVNIAIHIANGILLFVFLLWTLQLSGLKGDSTQRAAIAFLTAMLWFTNPLHTQSVTYIVQRANSMAAFFYLLAFCLYIQGRRSGGRLRQSWPWHLGALLAWILSLGCKQNAAILPLFILLYEWYFFQASDPQWLRRRLWIIAGVFAILLAVALLLLGQNPLDRLTNLYAFSRDRFTYGQRILTQPRVIVYYLSLFLFPRPDRLNIDYDYPLSTSLVSPPTTLIALILIGTALVIACWGARKHRLLSFSIFWYLGNLLIESSVIPLDIIFEHRTYLPTMLVPLMPVVWTFTHIRQKKLAVGVLLLPALLFSFWTYQRNKVWQDGITFWQDCVDKSPHKARPRFSLGAAFAASGAYEKAMAQYRMALEIDPEYGEVYNNIGNIDARRGDYAEAEAPYRKAIALQPAYVKAYYNLAVVLLAQEKYDEARAYLEQARHLDPNFADVYARIGDIDVAQGKTDQALEAYRQALDLSPEQPLVLSSIGKIYADKKEFDQARMYFEQALAQDPANAELLVDIGKLLQDQGHPHQALEYYRRAIAADPDTAAAHFNMANVYMTLDDKDKAERHYREALRLDPGLIEAHTNLGLLLAARGDTAEALAQNREALALDPTYASAYNNIGNILTEQKQFESAIANYQEAIRLDPKFEDAHVNLGIALLRMGDAEDARQQFEQALQLNPAHPGALQGMQILQSAGQAPGPVSPSDLHQQALAHARKGEYQAAIERFKEILAMMPSEPGTCYNIACMYAKMGDPAAALEWLQRAIQNGYDNWSAIKNDPDLENIRPTEGFKALIKGH